MKKNTLAWFVIAGAGIAFSGFGMAACSSSSATGTPGGDDSSSNDAGGDSTTNTGDSGPGTDSGGNTDAGADASCGTAPTLHTSTNDAGLSDIFCETASSVINYCQIEAGTANTCCINTSGTGFPDGECTTAAACPSTSIDLGCLDDKGCAAGEKCYGIGNAYVLKACGYQKVFGFKGTQCAANPGVVDATDAGHFELCSSSAGCSNAAATCVPTKEYVQFGTCSE
jgi:hypothetical protein